ncbi:MAG: BON domain-containing protein [Balneolaceae bacterium]|nr:BON domain-containing protein [Balneolaceae bacterium]
MRDDEDILADVAHHLDWDDRIESKEISVKVMNGNVDLEGTVPTMTDKSAAYDDAKLVDGVVSVTNNLDVQMPSTTTIPNDAKIKEHVRNSLSINSDVQSYSIDVTVENGWVTLEGTVKAFWEKISAENEVLEINGVLGVSNNLAVVPTDDYEDEIIAEEIVNALERNVHVTAEDVEVTVKNGSVTLAGFVKTFSAKNAAYESAIYTPGVISVDNRIVVG